MAEQKTKEELVRLSWITELRRQGDRQCANGTYTTGQLVCALGLLREVALPDWSEMDRENIDDVADVGALAGLNNDQSNEVTLRNDGDHYDFTAEDYHKHTFSEIADVVEGWFK